MRKMRMESSFFMQKRYIKNRLQSTASNLQPGTFNLFSALCLVQKT